MIKPQQGGSKVKTQWPAQYAQKVSFLQVKTLHFLLFFKDRYLWKIKHGQGRYN
jgi:hypothetical protein